MYRKCVKWLIICFLTLATTFISANENAYKWNISLNYEELSQDDFKHLNKDSLAWVYLRNAKYVFLNDGKTILSLQRMFTTTTGGIYLRVISVTEVEDSVNIIIEYPYPHSCQIHNKQVSNIYLYLSIENPQSKKLDIKFKRKDSCDKEEL